MLVALWQGCLLQILSDGLHPTNPSLCTNTNILQNSELLILPKCHCAWTPSQDLEYFANDIRLSPLHSYSHSAVCALQCDGKADGVGGRALLHVLIVTFGKWRITFNVSVNGYYCIYVWWPWMVFYYWGMSGSEIPTLLLNSLLLIRFGNMDF